MIRTTIAICAALVIGPAAFAGPNDGVVLTVHGNVNGAATGGVPDNAISLPFNCADMSPTAKPDQDGVEWFLVVAASPSRLRFDTITFGLGDYNQSLCYISFFGPARQDLAPLELPSLGWPAPNEGTAVTWSPNCLSGSLVPVYYFGIYAYGAGEIPLGDFYPAQRAVVVSCERPPDEDEILVFGSLGCGGAAGASACGERGRQAETTWGRIKKTYQ